MSSTQKIAHLATFEDIDTTRAVHIVPITGVIYDFPSSNCLTSTVFSFSLPF